jgi:hypothetical protein
MLTHKQRQAKLKESAKLLDDLGRSLELRDCLGKDIWTQGGSICNPVTTTLWEVNPGYGQFFDRWQVELANAKEVVFPRTSLAELKRTNAKLFAWVMEIPLLVTKKAQDKS